MKLFIQWKTSDALHIPWLKYTEFLMEGQQNSTYCGIIAHLALCKQASKSFRKPAYAYIWLKLYNYI